MNLLSLNPFARKTSSVAVQPPAASSSPAAKAAPGKSKGTAPKRAPAGPGLVERLWTSWLNRPRAMPAAPAPIAASASASAQDHFEAIRSQIEAFDEEKKGALERLMTFLFTLAAYVGPFIVALAVAQEIADTYSGAWQWGNSWSVATHLVAWFGELGLAALIVSIATAVRRAASDGEMLPRLVASIAAFVVFSVASGLAQWYVATLHVSPPTTAGQVALAFRVAMPVAIDLASMLYLSIMKIKSLKRYLAGSRDCRRHLVLCQAHPGGQKYASTIHGSVGVVAARAGCCEGITGVCEGITGSHAKASCMSVKRPSSDTCYVFEGRRALPTPGCFRRRCIPTSSL